MGFRPNYLSCIAHLYLYYTLLVPHTYASYTRLWCIFSHYEIQDNLPVFLAWYQSHCSDLFLVVLSLLVLLHSKHRFCRHNSRRSLSLLNLQRLPAIVSEFWTCSHCRWGVLHHRLLHMSSSACVLHFWYVSPRGITKIFFSWSTRQLKPHSHWAATPSCASQRFCVSVPRAVLSSNWRHSWRHL